MFNARDLLKASFGEERAFSYMYIVCTCNIHVREDVKMSYTFFILNRMHCKIQLLYGDHGCNYVNNILFYNRSRLHSMRLV